MKVSLLKCGIFLLALFLVFQSSEVQGAVFVPLDDPVYEFLDNCAARGLVPLTVRTTRPIARDEVAGYLVGLIDKYPELDDRILEEDLEYYIRDFASEVVLRLSERETRKRRLRPTGINVDDVLLNPHWHLSTVIKENFSLVFDPVVWMRLDGSISETSSRTIFRRGTGIQFRGEYSGLFGFYFRFVDHVETGKGAYSYRSDLFEDRYAYVGRLDGGSEVSYDLSEAYLAGRWKGVDFVFGRDKFRWGPGQSDQLLFSGAFPSIDHLRLTFDLFDKTSFTYLIGKLSPWAVPGDTLYQTSEGWTRILPAQKWVSAHRVEYQPLDWLVLAFNEAVIWGDRGIDIAYVNPLNFLFSAEHNGGDVDNVLMSGDFTARFADRGMLYGSLLIDDLSLSTLGEGNPGNKLGIMAGIRVSDIWIDGSEAGIEYTRLEPYVYSHFYPVNRFTTWTSKLGSSLSPNSDRLEARMRLRPRRSITVDLAVSTNRHGSVGGDVYQAVERNSQEKVRFLSGSRTEWSVLEASTSWEPLVGLNMVIGIVTGDREKPFPDRYYMSLGYCYK